MCKPSEDTGLTQLSLYLPGAQLGGSPADVSDELECLQQGGGWGWNIQDGFSHVSSTLMGSAGRFWSLFLAGLLGLLYMAADYHWIF